jgi:ABC-type lipoprotein release transport system permease subunit
MTDSFKLLLQLAFRNLGAHRIKNLLVGLILGFGTLLVVTGSSLLDSIKLSMEKSITSSVAGHLQLYSSEAKDPLALFGGTSFGAPEIGEIDDFPALEKTLLQDPNVAAVVPMGIVMPTVFGRNELDGLLEKLRDAVRLEDKAGMEVLAPRIREIAKDLRTELELSKAVASNQDTVASEREVLEKVDSDAFWQEFMLDPKTHIEYLDFKLAPLSPEGRIFYFRTLGTDLEQFPKQFDRFKIVDGQTVPPGQRGFLIAKRTYEEFVKNKVARELDLVAEALHEKGETIAESKSLQDRITRMARQYPRVLYQLSPEAARKLEQEMKGLMPDATGDLAQLLQHFLSIDDSNFESRYQFFYSNIAPHIQLYDAPVGSTITLRSYTASGYVRSTNIKIYGTFQFDGLERSDLAGVLNLTDLQTFRQLYGKMTEDQKQEMAGIQESVGVKEVSRADAEAALFGGGSSLESTEASTGFDEFANVDLKTSTETLDTRTYTAEAFRNGLVLNAAVLLKDPKTLSETQSRIQNLVQGKQQVVDWAQASGIVGQFILAVQAVLYVSIFIIFLVALVIINNIMVMATMERTFEIGTMRAIGAHRSFVQLLFLMETLLLGVISGAVGSLVSYLFLLYLGQVGIPAPADVVVVLFAGPRLYPTIGFDNILFGMITITLVSLLSTFYPARIAAGIPPVVAMSGKE